MRVKGIQHVNLNVADVERSRRFYQDVLGFAPSFAKDDTVWLDAGGDLLGLSRGEPPREHPNHWGFRVESGAEVNAWARHLTEHGAKLDKGPYDRSDGRSVYFSDPDGYLLEIFWVDPDLLAT